MRIIISSKLTVEQNAARYFERAKKSRKKIAGTRKAIEKAKERLKEDRPKQKQQPKREERKKDWYETFRWFYSSEGFLCIGGRDATTNELVVKKHVSKGDKVFHTDMAGSPFVVVKSEGKEIPKTTLEEAAQFVGCYSKAWKLGHGYIEVFYVDPDQVTKQANPGEFLPKGAFMIRGHTNYLKPKLEIAIGKRDDGKIMVGPQPAVEAHCPFGFIVRQGNEKISDVAKTLAKRLDCHPDDVIPLLPPGGVKLGVKILGISSR